jgi:hypothetical protein
MTLPLPAPQDSSIRRFLRQLKAEGVVLGGLPGPVLVELHRGLAQRRAAWVRIADAGALQGEFLALAAQLPDFDRLDLEIPRKRRTPDQAAFGRLGKVQTGLASLRLTFNGESERFGAGRLLAENRSFARALEHFCRRRGADPALFWAAGGAVEVTTVEQWRLHVAPEPRVVKLFRGGLLVAPEAVTPALVERMAGDLGGWLVRNTAEDGTLPYKWWPSRGEEATGDNALRRCMATLWLNRWAWHTGDPVARSAADRNLRRNLRVLYVEDAGRGYIDDSGKTKLGAAAFAATAIRESPLRAALADTLAKLDAGIHFLWNEDGSFRTFHRPVERDRDNQNFYPGEALVYLGLVHRETGDPALLAKALRSLAWYREWHLANRNPAFVPWHSQAGALFYAASGESWLRDWIFEMNDWLLSMQQTEVAYPDLLGRFYDPARPEYGSPHASSTGVYLEGLADAWMLAAAAADAARVERYGAAIRLGLRSIRQLQFRDEDLVPYRQPEKLAGGVRTEVYDNGLRVDNVQHALGACLKLIAQPRFMAWLASRPSAPPATP